MKAHHIHSFVVALAIAITSSPSAVSADECQPGTWTAAGLAAKRTPSSPRFTPSVQRRSASIQSSEINCRNWGNTYDNVNYYSCTQLAEKYGITVETFFKLNPGVDPDCETIRPNTKYCVNGFVEPVRSTDGFCGPQHNNATCLGTDKQCCNSETWTCGATEADCADGTCYEGTCAGDRVYSTDGKCGHQNGNRRCAGKWGSCCSVEGNCGTGTDFCGGDLCQSGNCTSLPGGDFLLSGLAEISGNTTDGVCGGEKRYTCSGFFGMCCNSHGRCGALPVDCGVGCQPEFGRCDTAQSVTSSVTPSVST